MFRILKILFKASFEFFPPSKNKILVYDLHSNEIINKIFLEERLSFLSTRKEKINIFIVLKTFFEFKFKYFDYLINYIKYVNPKLIITSTDNNKSFYQIKNYIPEIITIFFQNGHRTGGLGDIFEILEKKNINSFKRIYKVDLMCVFNQMTSDLYRKFIDGNSYIAGSVKNNSEKLIKKKKKDSLILISLFRSTREPFEREIKLLEIIYKFCLLNKIRIKILGKAKEKSQKEDEKNFYSKILGKKIIFIENSLKRESYKKLDGSDLVVSTGSTMGLESLGRCNKTAIFHTFPYIDPFKKNYWGYYTKRKKSGFFWSNEISEKKIFKILNNLKHTSKKKWLKIIKKYEYETCVYDYRNAKLKKAIKNICYQNNFNVTPFFK